MMISVISCMTHAERVEVFTINSLPVALNGVQASVCLLDAINTLTEELNHKAHLTASSRHDDANLNVRLTAMYHCKAQAVHYALSSLPAIVIDKTYVVYGMRTVDKALIASRHYAEVHHA